MASAVKLQTRPASLEGIPDDVLREVLSHLPTLTESHILFTCSKWRAPAIPSTSLVRTPALRALSQTSRLLRVRCLPMAWCRLELCTAPIPEHKNDMCCGSHCSHIWAYRDAVSRAVTYATQAAVRVLDVCTHLHSLIKTVTVVLTSVGSDEVVPAFATCLTKMPNLTSIQVIYADSAGIEKGFQGKRFPSVRKVSLPYTAHPILRSLPNVEEVVCIDGTGKDIIDSLVKGDCCRVRVLKGVKASLTPLVPLLHDLRYIEVPHEEERDMKSLANFPFLDTIEITSEGRDPPLLEDQIKEATDILKTNASRVNNKAVILTHWTGFRGNMTRQVIKV